MYVQPTHVDAVCERCGIQWTYNIRYNHRPEYDTTLCPDCKAKPVQMCLMHGFKCQPWHGEYDDEDNPIKDGKLYRPGVRLCGHRDCVRPSHIVSSANHTNHTPSSDLAA